MVFSAQYEGGVVREVQKHTSNQDRESVHWRHSANSGSIQVFFTVRVYYLVLSLRSSSTGLIASYDNTWITGRTTHGPLQVISNHLRCQFGKVFACNKNVTVGFFEKA